MNSKIVFKEFDVVVVSYGGVGTTFLLTYISKFFKTNCRKDSDGIKHLPFPPKSVSHRAKIIYIYGSPQLATISLFERKIHYSQSKKIQTKNSPIPHNMTLDEYLSLGIDKFHFREHFYNWYNHDFSCPVMFVRYETLFENIVSIIDFLELPRFCLHCFPKSKARNSKINEYPVKIKEQLDDLYGEFSDDLEKIDDVEIRKGRQPYSLSHLKYIKIYLGFLFLQIETYIRERPKIFRVAKKIKQLTKHSSGR